MEPPPIPSHPPPPVPTRPECDITKTQVMVDLFTVPAEQRDDQWRTTFLENVETASFMKGDPELLTGPDGFPYFVMRSPIPRQSFESFCIRNMKDDFILHNGWGIVINPTEASGDWVFTYGDIVNLHVSQKFYSDAQTPTVPPTEVIIAEEEVLIGQPSESYVPMHTRNILRTFLKNNGIAKPSFMMMARKMDGTVVQQLVFNIFNEDHTPEAIDYLMRPISWLLPRHYILIIIPKDSDLVKNFEEI